MALRDARQSGGVMARRGVMRGLRPRSRDERSGFTEAEVAAGVADDQVIEQRHVEDVGRLRQPKRESRIVRLGVGLPLGWLCTTSSAVVPGVRHAGTNTSGSEMDVLERVPRESTCQARRR